MADPDCPCPCHKSLDGMGHLNKPWEPHECCALGRKCPDDTPPTGKGE